MKKVTSLLLAAVMLISCVGGIQLTAGAADYTTLSTDIPLNGQWSGDYWLTATQNEAWYRITVPSDGKITLKTMTYFGCCYTDLYSYDLTDNYCNQHLHGNEVTPQTGTNDISLSSGTYYIKVSGDVGKYKLYISFTSYNVNDIGANSYDNPLNLASDFLITGALTATDREDWYRFTVYTTGKYSIRLTARFGCCYMNVYDYDLTTEICNSHLHGEELTPVTDTKNVVLSQGSYYIKISGDTGWYNLSWYALTPENCTHDFEKKTTSSTCTSQGYTTYTCKICGYSYNDDYKPLANHSFSSSTVYPTYFSGGYTVYTCKSCGYSYNDNYTAKLKVTKPSISSIKKGTKKFTVYFANYYGLDGIQVQYSTSKKFTKKTTKTVSTAKTYKAVNKLKKNKKYYVRVRGYKKADGKKVYSSWSKVKTVKTK